jgi:hypothetical protein
MNDSVKTKLPYLISRIILLVCIFSSAIIIILDRTLIHITVHILLQIKMTISCLSGPENHVRS